MASVVPMSDVGELRERFSRLHESGIFIMPNAWDIGSAVVLQSLGFEAIATTSSGFAASLGRHDQTVSLGELGVHVADLCDAIDIPLSVDAEAGYAVQSEGLPRTVGVLAGAGAAGVSIEDHMPDRGLLGAEEATDRVGRFVAAAREEGMTVTARAENHLYGVDDLDDTISRLRAYANAGADVLYAPGLGDLNQIQRLVSEVERPVNVLLVPGGPSVGGLGGVGVRRVSTGGALTFAAYGALARAGRELLESGTSEYAVGNLAWPDRDAAFGDD
ncbi:MAG TPA: isocitrate lyase/phosphoenolpyruvate mutase family protein [Acidimicrobiia bacterium]